MRNGVVNRRKYCRSWNQTWRDSLLSNENRWEFLHPISEKIGDPSGRNWKNEMPGLFKEWMVLKGSLSSMSDTKFERPGWCPFFHSFDNWVGNNEALNRDNITRELHAILREGQWDMEDGAVLKVCVDYSTVIAKAIADERSDYCALTHRFYSLLSHKAQITPESQVPICYKNMSGLNGLANYETGWMNLMKGDATGFCGFTAQGPTTVYQPFADGRDFSKEGFMVYNWTKQTREKQDSDVVRFLSRGPDERGMHTAIQRNGHTFIFPPLTQFRVVSVKDYFYECNIKVHRRLITVEATYLV